MVKGAYIYGVDSVSLLLLRMLFSLPFYLVILFLQKKNADKQPSKKDYTHLILFGFIGYYLASFFDFHGLNFIKASVERLILFVYPTLVLLISFFFLQKRVSKKQLLGVIITYVGIVVVFSTELVVGKNEDFLKGALFIFLSAFMYASYLVGSGQLIPKFGATRFTSLAMIVSSICVIGHYVFTTSDVIAIVDFPKEVYWIALLMAVVATVIPSYLISYAIKAVGAGNFAILGSLGPISTIILAYFFLGERLHWLQFVGAAVIISGIVVAERKRKSD